jgi:hypothetical protein
MSPERAAACLQGQRCSSSRKARSRRNGRRSLVEKPGCRMILASDFLIGPRNLLVDDESMPAVNLNGDVSRCTVSRERRAKTDRRAGAQTNRATIPSGRVRLVSSGRVGGWAGPNLARDLPAPFPANAAFCHRRLRFCRARGCRFPGARLALPGSGGTDSVGRGCSLRPQWGFLAFAVSLRCVNLLTFPLPTHRSAWHAPHGLAALALVGTIALVGFFNSRDRPTSRLGFSN